VADEVAADSVIASADAVGGHYRVVDCDPELADTANFCAHYGYEMADSANTILVVGKSEPRRYVACLVLANSRLDVNGVVRKRLGVRKASFASGEETVELTGMTIGGVTVFGLPEGMPIWIDSAVMDRQEVIVGGGSRDRKLLAPPATLAAIPGAEVVEGLAKPIEG
jgi:prolyl-tRNA editing enzyme YbaK/EbsC (Cys-tRNA(Pro) deacylase)